MKVASPRLIALTVALVSLMGLGWATGISIGVNRSASMPAGLYATWPTVGHHRGMIAVICLPPGDAATLFRARGYLPPSPRCTSGVAPILKPVAAVAGDVVHVTAAGVEINGHLVPNTQLFDTDQAGREIPHLPVGWQKQLASGEFFALSTHTARSLDSRYVGVLSTGQIVAAAHPLFLFE